MKSDSVEKSVQSINNALKETIIEKPEPVKKRGFFESIFVLEQPPKMIRVYDEEKIKDLAKQINPQINMLVSELKEYENIEKQIEVYLSKLKKQQEELENYYNELNNNINNTNDKNNFVDSLNQKTRKEIINSKITTVKTTIALMQQELLSVHNAIVNHFITINSLQASSVILPILNSELAIYRGNQTESNAIETVNNLFGLVEGVINKNALLTKENLKKLQEIPVSNIRFDDLAIEINHYLKTIDETKLLLDSPNQEQVEEKKQEQHDKEEYLDSNRKILRPEPFGTVATR